MTITVQPDPAHPAGHALIRIPGAAAAASTPGFRIQREEDWDEDKLGPTGWQSSDALLTPDRAEPSGADLVLHVGWPVCRHLEAGVYTIELPASGQPPAPVFWPDITPLHAGAVDINTRTAPPEPTPPPINPTITKAKPPKLDPVPDPAIKEPVTGPAPQPPPGPTQPDPTKRNLALTVLLLFLLGAAGGAYFVYTHRPPETPVATQTPPPPDTTPPRPSLANLPVPDVIAQAPNPAAIAAEGTRRLQADRRDDGLLLLEAAADRNDPTAAAALARLYDPVLFQPGGPIPKPDPRQAARYYRDAARAGADVTAPREALRQSLETRAQSGDLGANLSLKDFWP